MKNLKTSKYGVKGKQKCIKICCIYEAKKMNIKNDYNGLKCRNKET
jgi:hypothetical protein